MCILYIEPISSFTSLFIDKHKNACFFNFLYRGQRRSQDFSMEGDERNCYMINCKGYQK